MSKVKAYALSTGDRNSCILVPAGDQIPPGYTLKEPPQPMDGYQVQWNESLAIGQGDWEQVEIPATTE
ncbi:hypothetical protein [Alkalimonas mucilaginosa]|uniref:Uncharacterized protein n=1 Tax=Alkalimonas mucilaginosa TaxID=3057676 RepID=A0ABU7JD27_9GAMM|nr:hypothetical protein [Alkalimonas sp. MEB004]MEE2023597.1 hypothetical protein [Alkalimonas sp. MEB004]